MVCRQSFLSVCPLMLTSEPREKDGPLMNVLQNRFEWSHFIIEALCDFLVYFCYQRIDMFGIFCNIFAFLHYVRYYGKTSVLLFALYAGGSAISDSYWEATPTSLLVSWFPSVSLGLSICGRITEDYRRKQEHWYSICKNSYDVVTCHPMPCYFTPHAQILSDLIMGNYWIAFR